MIVDLHCDLLLYLQKESHRTPYDSAARCSIPQMRVGQVHMQVLPIFAETAANSSRQGQLQNNIFHSLSHQFPLEYRHLPSFAIAERPSDKINIIRAIENASTFCEEEEPLSHGLKRLKEWLLEGEIAYISLTWNSGNRFGGGCYTAQGITNDGKALLDFMSEKNIAVDLSHASDTLAYDILDHIDNNGLEIPVMASHSNCRTLANVPRNLPDGLISEIFRRQGIIGLNVIKPFVGPSPLFFPKHVKHLLQLGGENHLCFGADFFFEQDIPLAIRRAPGEYFFEEVGHSGAYGRLIELCGHELNLPHETLTKISSSNALRFLKNRVKEIPPQSLP